MKLMTVNIPAVELTQDEEHAMWFRDKWSEYNIENWNTSDGNNEILFNGETCYRVVVRKSVDTGFNIKLTKETQSIVDDLFKEIKRLVECPASKICRHWAALNIVELLEKHGVTIPNGLAKSLCDGSEGDEKSLKILNKLV